MRTAALMNGGLIGFGLGFIAASLALQFVVRDYVTQSVLIWQFRGVAVVGGLGLLFGIAFEIYERRRLKKEAEAAEESESDERGE